MWWQQEWQVGVSKAVPAAFPSSCVAVLWQEHALCACLGRGMATGLSCSVLGRCTGQAELRKSQERSSTAGDFHHLLLHIDFFHSAKCHHSTWVSQKMGEWARKELYQDVLSSWIGLMCRRVCRKRELPQAALSQTYSQQEVLQGADKR